MSHDHGPANENTLGPVGERRSTPRHRVFLKGKIVYLNNSLSADCTIRDLSPRGARIQVNPDVVSGDPFLIVVKDAVIHQSVTAWKSGAQAGLRFQDATSLSGDVPLHLRHAQRLWVELMPR